jgi:hypothetical protein
LIDNEDEGENNKEKSRRFITVFLKVSRFRIWWIHRSFEENRRQQGADPGKSRFDPDFPE